MALDEAELYACLHRGNPGDTDFYARCCDGARNILELGSGYGRMAFTLGQLGHTVTGLELDPGLLERSRVDLEARQGLGQRVRFLFGDMRNFELNEDFDRVIIPYSGLYCLLSSAEVEACLGAAYRHLAPGGRLCLDGYYADAFHADLEPQDVPSDQLEPVVSVVHEGELLQVHERSTWDKTAQRVDAFYEYRDAGGILVHTGVVRQRYLLVRQMRELLDTAGFTELELSADFSSGPLVDETETVAFVARKPHPQSAPKTASA